MAAWSALAATACASIAFVPLGDLPGGNVNSTATGISDDGTVVVGQSFSSDGPEAFRWTAGGGMVGLGVLSNANFESGANAVSGDGAVVVGSSKNTLGDSEAFRWTSGGGMVGLNAPPGDVLFNTTANGASADGSVVVGGGQPAPLQDSAYRWTAATGMVTIGLDSAATDVSADGAVVVGNRNVSSAAEAFRWVVGDASPTGLGFLPGGSFSQGFGVSDDGATVVGTSTSTAAGGSLEAFLWTMGGGMIGLGDLAGGGFLSIALDVSGDGNVVVGAGFSAVGLEAFVWRQGQGMLSIRDALINGGINMTGWTLQQATGVSGDGRFITGFGINPSGDAEGWWVELPPVPELASITVWTLLALCGVALGRDRR
jgi:probable HAF family extracellular repeat protein